MKVTKNELVSVSMTRHFTIKLDSGEEIVVQKYVVDDSMCADVTDADWDVIDGEEIYNDLPDEEKDKVYDFILDLKMM